MSFSAKAREFAASWKRNAGAWRLIGALAILAAFGAGYVGKKLAPAHKATQARAETETPAAPRPPAAPESAKEPPALEQPAESLDGQTVDVPARPVATLSGEGNWTESFKILSEAIAKLTAAVAKAGLESTGRPFVAFTETNDNGFKFKAMLAVVRPPAGGARLADGVELDVSPSGKALKFQHRGPYDDIDSTYEAITAFLDEKGLDAQGVFVEEYPGGLKSAEDESLEVDVYVFLK